MLDENPNVFAQNPLDRASEKRVDADWIAEKLSDSSSLILPMWRLQPFLIERDGGKTLDVGWLRPGLLPMAADAATVFLGLDGDRAYFALDLDAPADPAEEGALAGLGVFADLRESASRLDPGEAAILAQAKSMIDWHGRHRFCANCGAPTKVVEAGYKRSCDNCGAEHFPRVDPVVIVLPVRDGQCLLGRSPQWPPGFYSAMAGFIEPGETIEQAARRELMEESNVRIKKVRIHSSQPWPYPSSLMIGCFAEAEDGEIKVDGVEIEAARWFSLDEIRAMIETKSYSLSISGKGDANQFRMPPPMAIAHHLIRSWAEEQ